MNLELKSEDKNFSARILDSTEGSFLRLDTQDGGYVWYFATRAGWSLSDPDDAQELEESLQSFDKEKLQ